MANVSASGKRAGRWRCRLERPHDHPRERETRGTADDRKEDALGQQLSHETGAARADGKPHRELAPAGGGSGQQQVRDVRARDQQHGADDAAEQPGNRLHLPTLNGVAVIDRSHEHAHLGRREVDAPRVRGRHRLELRSRLLDGGARPEQTDLDNQPPPGLWSRSGFISPE